MSAEDKRAWIVRMGENPIRLLLGGDGLYRVEHLCVGGDGKPHMVAPRLSAHNVAPHMVTSGGMTVRPSVHCLGCGLHGWITDGKWEDA